MIKSISKMTFAPMICAVIASMYATKVNAESKIHKCPRTIDLTNKKLCHPSGEYYDCRIQDPAGGYWEGKIYTGRRVSTEEDSAKSKKVAQFFDIDLDKVFGCEVEYREDGSRYYSHLKNDEVTPDKCHKVDHGFGCKVGN